jgi:FtsZ-binding cell division protein ZapB
MSGKEIDFTNTDVVAAHLQIDKLEQENNSLRGTVCDLERQVNFWNENAVKNAQEKNKWETKAKMLFHLLEEALNGG